METSLQPKAEQAQSPFRDLAKITLTSLALMGLPGCRSSSVDELIAVRPESTPVAVVKEKELWLGKEVTIKAQPVLISDNSTLYYDGSKYGDLFLNLDLRYELRTDDPAAAGKLIMIDDRSICLTRRNFDPKNPAGPYVLPESTYLVSGKIDKYSNSSDVYLRYMNSFYRSDSETSR